jgi:hypothetical protein
MLPKRTRSSSVEEKYDISSPSPKPIHHHAHLEEAPEGWEHVGRDGGRLDEDAAWVEGAFVVDGSSHEQEMDG